MEFVITDFPKDLGLKKERIKPGERYAFDQISDKLIVWDRSPNKNSYLKRGFGFLSIVLFFTLYFTPWNPGTTLWVIILNGVILTVPSIWYFLLWKYEPEKKAIIFNRLESTVQLPGILADRPHLIKFVDLHAVFAMNKYNHYLDARRNRNWWDRLYTGVLLSIFGWSPEESWSYWVWYMDKNRPLPPGSAFDPYRKKDYERRKAEGCPPPLYESKIPTPEYAPGEEGSIVDNLN